VAVSDVEELTEGMPEEVALQNARRKALAAASGADALVLGVDTVVVLDGRIYGKPADRGEARVTLRALSGRRHEVLSGLCLLRGGGPERTAVVRTGVQFRVLDARLLDWYLASQEWRERAGGYAIQGRGAALVSAIDGDYLNVVGLPVAKLLELAPEILVA
jgi:septum formation protein